MSIGFRRAAAAGSLALVMCGRVAAAGQHEQHGGAHATPGWSLMQDGVVFALFNHQGGERGGDEFRVPNWWMGMATRRSGPSELTFTAMLSLDPATVGKRGYREIFQVGEAVDGQPLVDRQHPHDFFMQLGAVWRRALSDRTGLTIAGAPVGEPALGPVAFMHRQSAAENPFAPLGHHTFDSTHIAFGVITAGIDRGPFVLEGSLFNGREPDEDRWDFDFGRLDSLSTRLWYKPSASWELQVSSGRLKDPEELEPGIVVRTTASAAWLRERAGTTTAVSIGYGVNDTDHGTRQAAFAEATHRIGRVAAFGRLEVVQLETEALLGDDHHPEEASNRPLLALTIGGVGDVFRWRGFEGAIGADLTAHVVPEVLQATHGRSPVSALLFFRLRPPAPGGRMWNMRMSQPMAGHAMTPR